MQPVGLGNTKMLTDYALESPRPLVTRFWRDIQTPSREGRKARAGILERRKRGEEHSEARRSNTMRCPIWSVLGKGFGEIQDREG